MDAGGWMRRATGGFHESIGLMSETSKTAVTSNSALLGCPGVGDGYPASQPKEVLLNPHMDVFSSS